MHTLNVLFLAANPADKQPLRLDEQVRLITEKIQASEYRNAIDFITKWAVRTDDLLQALNQHSPQIVHFSGHGTPAHELLVVNQQGLSQPISPVALKALFTAFNDRIRMVILDACYSRAQAQALVEVIDCAIGMSAAIGETAAMLFTASFYRALGFGKSIQAAFDQGKIALLLEGHSDAQIPELLCKTGVNPAAIVLIEPEALEAPHHSGRQINVGGDYFEHIGGNAKVITGPIYHNSPPSQDTEHGK